MPDLIFPASTGGRHGLSHTTAEAESIDALFIGETFDLNCLRFDDAFVAWANSVWGPSPAWDGTVQGNLRGWAYTSPGAHLASSTPGPGYGTGGAGFAVIVGFGARLDDGDSFGFGVMLRDFTVISSEFFWITNGFIPWHGSPDTYGIPVFGSYQVVVGGGDYFGSAIFRHSGPSVITIGPCDAVNPPQKLDFFTDIAFVTPAGTLSIGARILHLLDGTHPPSTWNRRGNVEGYDYHFSVQSTGPYVLLGLSKPNDPLFQDGLGNQIFKYAEFDAFDLPAAPISPVGIFKRGNLQGLDGLPTGYSYASGDFVSIVGQ